MWRISTHDFSEYSSIEAAVVQSFVNKAALRTFLPILLQKEACSLKLCGVASLQQTISGSDWIQSQQLVGPPVSRNRLRSPAFKHSRGLKASSIDISKIESIETTYIGHSMGGIIGVAWAVFTGYARSAHLAGGSPFSYVMGRSAAFALLKLAFDLQFYKR